MKRPIIYFIIIIGIALFACRIENAFAGHKIRKQIIIIPPLETYLLGFESKKAFNNNEILFSDLGKFIYYNMIEGITLFNKQSSLNHKNIIYQLATNESLIPNYKSNNHIHKFYSCIKSDKKRLAKNLQSKDSAAFVWIDYLSDYKSTISNCMRLTTCENIEVPVKVVLFDGKKTQERALHLKFKKNYLLFSNKSLTDIKQTVSYLLYENRFPKPIQKDKSEKKAEDSEKDKSDTENKKDAHSKDKQKRNQ